MSSCHRGTAPKARADKNAAQVQPMTALRNSEDAKGRVICRSIWLADSPSRARNAIIFSLAKLSDLYAQVASLRHARGNRPCLWVNGNRRPVGIIFLVIFFGGGALICF